MNKLVIDTRNNEEIIVVLQTDEGEFVEKSAARNEKAQATLPLIERLLKKAKIDIGDINELKVERGPGSFTGVRIGVSIANALGLSNLAKINNKNIGEIETPEYK